MDLHARAFDKALSDIEALAEDSFSPRLKGLLPKEEAPVAPAPEEAPGMDDDDMRRLAELYASEGG